MPRTRGRGQRQEGRVHRGASRAAGMGRGVAQRKVLERAAKTRVVKQVTAKSVSRPTTTAAVTSAPSITGQKSSFTNKTRTLKEITGRELIARGARTRFARKGVAIAAKGLRRFGGRLGAKAAKGLVKGLGKMAAGAAIGGLATAASLAYDAKKELGQVAGGLGTLFLAAPAMFSASVSTAWTTAAAALVGGAAVVAAILVIINMGAYIVPPGELTALSGVDAPEEFSGNCPLIDGFLLPNWGSYDRSTEETAGHGSNFYWDRVDTSLGDCGYSQPDGSGCYAPTSAPGNRCYDTLSSAQRCSFYGYAADFISNTSNAVYLPKINGQELSWNFAYSRAMASGSQGYMYTYIDTTGQYTLIYGHISGSSLKARDIPSGTRIGTLHPWARTHLHLVAILEGEYVKPEQVFCK